MIFSALSIVLTTLFFSLTGSPLPYTVEPHTVSQSQEEVRAKDLSVFADDKRFDQKITLFRLKITVKDAITLLSTQSGISLTLKEPAEYADRELCLSLCDVPLRSVVEALAALFTYKNFGWHWSVRNRDGVNVYTLFPFGDQQKAVDAMHAQINADFVKSVNDTANVLNYSDEQLRKLGKKDSQLAHLGNSDAVSAERWRSGMKAFYEGLTEEQRQAVLQGQRITVPASIHPSIGAFIQYEWTHPQQQGTPPDSITVTLGTRLHEIAPELVISEGQLGGRNYIGGPFTEDAVLDKVRQSWLTRHDEKIDDRESQILPTPPADQTDKQKKEVPQGTDDSVVLLWRLSEASGLSSIALYRAQIPGIGTSFGTPNDDPVKLPPYGKMLGPVLDNLLDIAYRWHHKWHDGVLLLRNPGEPYMQPLIPVTVVPPIPLSSP